MSSSTDQYRQEFLTLGIGAVGCYATAKNEWGSFPCDISIPDSRLTPYLGDVVEGGTIIDKRPCVNRDDFVRTVVSGPMLNGSLPKGTIHLWSGNKAEPCSDPSLARSCDYLSLDLYVQLWASKGARIGVRRGEYIEWNDGPLFPVVKEKIPPAAERYKCDR